MLARLTPEQAEALLTALLLIVTALAALLTTFAVTLGRRVVRHLSALSGVQVSAEQQQKVDQAIAAGVAYAEEQARKFARELIREGPRTGEEKLEVAKTAARSIAPGPLASTSDAQLSILTEAKLQSLRPSQAPPSPDSVSPASSFVPRMPPPPTFSTIETRPTPMPPRRNP
jgi:hypothetical protein